MKYILFFSTFFAIPPAVLLLTMNRRWLRYACPFLLLPIIFFDKVSINFFSQESYRGTSRGLEISLIYLVALTILLTCLLLKGKIQLLPDRGAVFYLLYFLLSIPSFQNAASPLLAFCELWKMIMMFLLFLAVYNYLLLQNDLRIFLISFGILAIYNFLTVILQHFQGRPQACGIFPHHNSMSMYLVIIGPLFLSYYLNHRKSLYQLLSGFCFLCTLAACARSYSRGATVSFPLGCAVTLFVSMLYQFTTRKFILILPLVFCAIVGILLLLPKIIQRFETAPKESLETRQYLAASAMKMIRDKPYAGVGLNNWGIKINYPYTYRVALTESQEIPENSDFKEGIVETIYLLVGAECGLFCLGALLLWLGSYLLLSFFMLNQFRRTEAFFLPAAMLGGLTGVYVQSVLEWVLKQQVNFAQLMILFAILSYLHVHQKEIVRGKIKLIL